MRFKTPGRVGDSPIPGHGLWVHPVHGPCVATGSGELMMGSTTALLAVEAMRAGAFDYLTKPFRTDEVLLTPTSQVPPFPVGEEGVREVEGRNLGRYTDWMRSGSRLTVPGGPSISIPAGWSAEGLPIGIQLAARFGDEATLFRISAQLEEARPWFAQRPSMLQNGAA